MAWISAVRSEEAAQAELLREIVGRPFRPVALDPAWRTPDVLDLVTTIDSERTFNRIPELAAALERAGCTNAEILSHCRGPGQHVLGCWVVDLIVGKP